MFKKDNDIIDILRSENKRLKKEVYRLQSSLDEIDKYKTDYEDLIKQVHVIKEQYLDKLSALNDIEKEYKKHLETLFKKERKELNKI